MIYYINYQQGHVGLTAIKLSINYMSDALMPTYQQNHVGLTVLELSINYMPDALMPTYQELLNDPHCYNCQT